MSLDGRTVVVTGASRGFGRAISTGLVGAGARVVGVARSVDALAEVRDELGSAFEPVAADAADQRVARELLDRCQPDVLVLNAGAAPVMLPLQEQTWETFGRNWEVDTRQVFGWIVEALRQPMRAGSMVITMSSGAALFGSPLSGGYAPAKAAIRFLRTYAAEESTALGLGIRFVALLPQLTPSTGLGRTGVAAYAQRQGVDEATFLAARQPLLTAEGLGEAVVELIAGPEMDQAEYVLTGAGPGPIP